MNCDWANGGYLKRSEGTLRENGVFSLPLAPEAGRQTPDATPEPDISSLSPQLGSIGLQTEDAFALVVGVGFCLLEPDKPWF